MNLKDIIKKQSSIKPKKEVSITFDKIDLKDFIKAITYSKVDMDFSLEEVNKAYSQYLVNKKIGSCEQLVDLAVELNMFHNLTNEQHFKMLKTILPQNKYDFKFTKQKSKTTEQDRKRNISLQEKNCICDYFEIGFRDVDSYIRQMDDEEIKDILRKYQYGEDKLMVV